MDVEKKDAPYGMDKITTDGGTVFYRNKNGIFDKRGEKIMNEYELRELAQRRVSSCDDMDTLMDWAEDFWLREYKEDVNLRDEHMETYGDNLGL